MMQSSAHTKLRMFLLFCCPACEEDDGAQEAGNGDNKDSWPKLRKGIFHNIKMNNLIWRELPKGAAVAQGLAASEQLYCASLVFHHSFISIKHHFSSWVLHFYFQILSLVPCQGGTVQMAVCCLAAWQTNPQHKLIFHKITIKSPGNTI